MAVDQNHVGLALVAEMDVGVERPSGADVIEFLEEGALLARGGLKIVDLCGVGEEGGP